MKKTLLINALILTGGLLVSNPAHALFVNGGFEDGTFNGWTLEYGNVRLDTAAPVWGVNPSNGQVTPQIIDNTYVGPGETVDVNPYTGSKMAKINDIIGGYNATRIMQTDTIKQADIDSGLTLYVNWGAMLVDPGHPGYDQPYFSIKVLNGINLIDSFSANASDASAAGSGWLLAGNDGNSPLYYKTGQYQLSLASFTLGASITVDMFVADCGQSGHGGYAFLDGVGTTYVPPPNGGPAVPEPTTMLLFGTGLAGLAAVGRRKAKK